MVLLELVARVIAVYNLESLDGDVIIDFRKFQ